MRKIRIRWILLFLLIWQAAVIGAAALVAALRVPPRPPAPPPHAIELIASLTKPTAAELERSRHLVDRFYEYYRRRQDALCAMSEKTLNGFSCDLPKEESISEPDWPFHASIKSFLASACHKPSTLLSFVQAGCCNLQTVALLQQASQTSDERTPGGRQQLDSAITIAHFLNGELKLV